MSSIGALLSGPVGFSSLETFQAIFTHYRHLLHYICKADATFSALVPSDNLNQSRLFLSPVFKRGVHKFCDVYFSNTSSAIEKDNSLRELRKLIDCGLYDDRVLSSGDLPIISNGQFATFAATNDVFLRNPREFSFINETFQSEMSMLVGDRRCSIRPIGSNHRHLIEDAIASLHKISELITQDIILNVKYICMLDYYDWSLQDENDYGEIGQSVSSHLVPSTIFLSKYVVENKNLLMESIFHESLHKKLSNFLVVQKLLLDDDTKRNMKKYHSYWNIDTKWNSNKWEVDRVLYAFHVYVHLVAYYNDFVKSNMFDWSDAIVQKNTSIERAQALLCWLESDSSDQLTDAGRRFVKELANRSGVRTWRKGKSAT